MSQIGKRIRKIRPVGGLKEAPGGSSMSTGEYSKMIRKNRNMPGLLASQEEHDRWIASTRKRPIRGLLCEPKERLIPIEELFRPIQKKGQQGGGL